MVQLPNEVFISHSSLDREFATEISEVLRRHGIPFWDSRRDIVGAQQWHDEIGEALKRCDWLAVLLSQHSVESVWVKRELLFSLKDHRYDERIVPVLFQPRDYDNYPGHCLCFKSLITPNPLRRGVEIFCGSGALGIDLRFLSISD